MGIAGTLTGTSLRLKEANPQIKVISVEPDFPFHGIEGTKHMDSTIHPAFYNPNLADQKLEVKTEDAIAMARLLATKEGLLVGISSGANISASIALANSLAPNQEHHLVTILCDNGYRYFSQGIFD